MSQPDLILTPFAKNATPGTIEDIPETRAPSDPAQRADWNSGFPQITMTPLGAGGKPPRGQDFNGVLNAISQHTVYVGGGGQYKWSQEYVDATGGYSVGNIIQSDDGMKSYVSTIDNNTINFNSSPSSIGVQWKIWSSAEFEDAVLKPELASDAGAGLVGFSQDYQGSVTRTVEDKLSEVVDVKDFGAIGGAVHLLSERFATLAQAQAEYPFVTSLSDSIDWAAWQAALNTGKLVDSDDKVYFLSRGLYINNNSDTMSGIWASGIDVWEQLYPSLPKKNGKGTHLVFYGEGEKIYSCPGVSDNAVSGGAFANPVPVALDTTYSLESFQNPDAASGVPSTPRMFSCGIYIAPGSRNVVLKGFRLHPNFDGIAGYNNAATYGLGDNWDVGIFNDNSPDVWIDEVQSVGYWRIAGMFQASVTRTGVQGGSYQCRYGKVNFQGRCGFLLRGGDTYRMLQRTATTVDIPWQDSHPFPNSGSFNTNVGSFPYTSTSKVLDGTYGNVLRFSGVSGDTSGVSQVRIASGFGIGGTSAIQYLFTGLEHTSGKKSSSFEIGLGVSKAVEVSGGFRRGSFSYGSVQTSEDVVLHAHNIDDMRFIETQFESNGKKGRMIASPQDINNTRVPYANGSTSLTLIACHMAGTDELPLVSRSDTGSDLTGAGFWQPRAIHDQDRQIPDSSSLDLNPMLTQNVRVNLKSGMQFLVRNASTSNILTVNESGNLSVAGQISLPSSAPGYINTGAGQVLNIRQGTTPSWIVTAARSWLPGSDAGQNLGAADARINSSFFAVAPTVGSDKHLKRIRGLLNEPELAACGTILPQVYQLLDMVESKGEDAARLHFGYIAQEVQQAFIDQGLDPSRYALWCEDAITKKVKKVAKVKQQKLDKLMQPIEKIEIREGLPVLVLAYEEVEIPVVEQVALTNEDGSPALDDKGMQRYVSIPVMEEVDEEIEVDEPDGFRQSLRYTELQVLKEAYLHTMIAKLEARIAILESN